jgi:glycosyltransferase involved in cell wall biosynthesis
VETTSSFPTLAERLAAGRPRADAQPVKRPTTIWIEASTPSDAGLTLPNLASVPTDSFVAVVGRGVARTAGAAEADVEAIDEWPSRSLRLLDDVRELLDESPGADVLLIESGRDLSENVVRLLRAAAYSDSVCASVSYAEDQDEGGKGDGARSRSDVIPPPAIARPSWGLVYVRRDAIDLALDNSRAVDGDSIPVGSIREALDVLLDGAGFVHRCVSRRDAAHADRGPARAKLVDRPISVILDMRHLADSVTGTQIQAVGLLGALARIDDLRVSALAPDRPHPSVLPLLEPLKDEVVFAPPRRLEKTDIFHRPHQIVVLQDLLECFALGSRFILTHQDMIMERSPAYFASLADWEEFRRTTSAAFASADHVGFFSEHAALDAASDGVLEVERATVVPLGVDHIRNDLPVQPPGRLSSLGERPFLLVVGTAFEHKNRLFALRVLRELVIGQGWEGGLVLAGMDAPSGSSLPEEQRLLKRNPALSERVLALGHVSESEKGALYRAAAVTLFPSLYEGFGLIPFESAAFGTPCLYPWRASLPEFLPRAGAMPSDFSAELTARMILELVNTAAARDELVAEIRGHAATLTWDRTARGYAEVYERALARPPRPVNRDVLRAVAGGPSGGIPLSALERSVIQVYRRRRGFRKIVDSMIRVGAVTTKTGRRVRARRDGLGND